ncbi:MAG: 4Fe-4S binding protein [Peptostreptococcaceae bacterium]|nr:4Fe-4S binding protein [Peptostreptococcaceae bacterium]
MKEKWFLTFPPELTEEPVTYTLIKNYDLRINILRASIGLNVTGNLLILIDGTPNAISEALTWLKTTGINVDSGDSQIIWNDELCVHCGACTAVCPAKALSLDPKTWLLSFSPEKCLACGHCIPACPLGAITNQKRRENV